MEWFMRGRRRKNLYICDGKNDELYTSIWSYLGEFIELAKQFIDEKIMNRYDRMQVEVLLEAEFAALNCISPQWQFKKSDGWKLQRLQHPKTSVLDGAIRDIQ